MVEDDPATLLELGQYFESIGFYPEAKQTYLHLKDDYPEVYLSLATIVARMVLWKKHLLIWKKSLKVRNGI